MSDGARALQVLITTRGARVAAEVTRRHPLPWRLHGAVLCDATGAAVLRIEGDTAARELVAELVARVMADAFNVKG